jgi:hypothetical protein
MYTTLEPGLILKNLIKPELGSSDPQTFHEIFATASGTVGVQQAKCFSTSVLLLADTPMVKGGDLYNHDGIKQNLSESIAIKFQMWCFDESFGGKSCVSKIALEKFGRLTYLPMPIQFQRY